MKNSALSAKQGAKQCAVSLDGVSVRHCLASAAIHNHQTLKNVVPDDGIPGDDRKGTKLGCKGQALNLKGSRDYRALASWFFSLYPARTMAPTIVCIISYRQYTSIATDMCVELLEIRDKCPLTFQQAAGLMRWV